MIAHQIIQSPLVLTYSFDKPVSTTSSIKSCVQFIGVSVHFLKFHGADPGSKASSRSCHIHECFRGGRSRTGPRTVIRQHKLHNKMLVLVVVRLLRCVDYLLIPESMPFAYTNINLVLISYAEFISVRRFLTNRKLLK